PYLLAGMKIAGGLSLIGAVTAELVAAAGNDLGLGWVILLANRNLDTAQEFAALALLSLLGVAILFAMTALEWALLHRWHESAVKKQGCRPCSDNIVLPIVGRGSAFFDVRKQGGAAVPAAV